MKADFGSHFREKKAKDIEHFSGLITKCSVSSHFYFILFYFYFYIVIYNACCLDIPGSSLYMS